MTFSRLGMTTLRSRRNILNSALTAATGMALSACGQSSQRQVGAPPGTASTSQAGASSSTTIASKTTVSSSASTGIKAVVASPSAAASSARQKVTITLFGNSTAHNEFPVPPDSSVLPLFSQSYPEITVEVVPETVQDHTKYIAALAGGTQADTVLIGDWQTPSLAESALLAPIDTLWKVDQFSEADVFPTVWQAMSYRGHVWTMPVTQSGVFALFYNLDLFAALGLAGPPTSIQELDDDVGRFFQGGTDGSITRLGMDPKMVWGWTANAIYTWGYAFGGKFYDTGTGKVTANDPLNVAALQWMAGYSRRWGVDAVKKFQSSYGTKLQAPFYVGKFPMEFGYAAVLNDMQQNAPHFRLGASWLPAGPAPQGEAHSDWLGGPRMALAPGSKHPDETWTFIKFCTSSAAGTGFIWSNGWPPGWKNTPVWDKISKDVQNDPVRKLLFYDMVVEGKHIRPSFAATAYLNSQLDTAVNAAFMGTKQPGEALNEATTLTQQELERLLAQSKLK